MTAKKEKEEEPKVRIETSSREALWAEFEEWWKKRGEDVREQFRQDMVMLIESIQKQESIFTRQIAAYESQAESLKGIDESLKQLVKQYGTYGRGD